MNSNKQVRIDQDRASEVEKIAKESAKAGLKVSVPVIVNMALGFGLPEVRKKLLGK